MTTKTIANIDSTNANTTACALAEPQNRVAAHCNPETVVFLIERTSNWEGTQSRAVIVTRGHHDHPATVEEVSVQEARNRYRALRSAGYHATDNFSVRAVVEGTPRLKGQN